MNERKAEGSERVHEAVRDRYARAARAAGAGGASTCGCGSATAENPITSGLYESSEVAGLPERAVRASLGCGVPTALADLRPGDVVLDLGSGGGLDVLLSARRVAPGGKAYGLDMTDEMLDLARQNAHQAGVENVEFLKGYMEEIPLPAASVDVVISNCVVNLSPDKDRVFQEIFRVLRPGGRLAIADVVVQGTLPGDVRRDLELWAGCLAGALTDEEYRAKLADAGFLDVEIEVLRVHDPAELARAGGCCEASTETLDASAGRFCSAFVRGRRPE